MIRIENTQELLSYAEALQKDMFEIVGRHPQYVPKLISFYEKPHEADYGAIGRIVCLFRYEVSEGTLDFELSLYITEGYVSFRQGIWGRKFSAAGEFMGGSSVELGLDEFYYSEDTSSVIEVQDIIKRGLLNLAYEITYMLENGTPQDLYHRIGHP